MPVGIDERHVPFQQRRHHIFRDGLLVAKAIAYNGRIGNRAKIDGVIARAWHMKKLQLLRPGQFAGKPHANDDIRRGIHLRMGAIGQNVGQNGDLRCLANETVEVVAKRRRVLSVKNNAHGLKSRVRSAKNKCGSVVAEIGKAAVE